VRRQIAKEWQCPPWVVDQAPWYEVANALDFLRIEGEVAAWKRQHRG
jgi:hypothetical protein